MSESRSSGHRKPSRPSLDQRENAMQILYCIDRYLSTRAGDVKKLRPPRTDLRLRCGDYRVFFDFHDESTIEISGVRHRREAYR